MRPRGIQPRSKTRRARREGFFYCCLLAEMDEPADESLDSRFRARLFRISASRRGTGTNRGLTTSFSSQSA